MENKVEIENILPLVQKPVRYINQEWNAYRKIFTKDNTSVCLCFPDLYEVGASNLGLEILYHIINRKDLSFAERSYLPAPDMENLMRQKGIPLFSLETKTPAKNFDILGISLQYELCSANVLNLLSLADIPFYAKDRKDLFPLVIGGGPMTLNPEPLADFFDAFVLGDGEEAMLEIIDAVSKVKSSHKEKEELLEVLSKIEGVYVPSFYDVEYNADGTIKSVLPNRKDVPVKVRKRAEKLENALVPTEKIVPYMETIHNRINIEIARGCPRKCRFCSASKYYFPWRTRTPKQVIELASKSIANTGFGEISFSSLSCTDYKDLNEVLSEFRNQFCEKRINVSLPSLRCDKFSLEIAKNLDYNKKTNLTFAPEAGTERLRNVIGKYLSDKNIIETLLLAYSMGWQNVKLYFMLGLPTETSEDIEGINSLIRYIKKQVPRFNFNIALSYFVPKAQTPFQWAAMEKEEILKDKMHKLKKILPASIKSSIVEPSVLEGVLARGDRRLSKVIHKVWQKGARFDQWKEQFDFSLWKDSFEEEKIDYTFYIYRQRNENERFPWDHLDFGIKKEDLLKEYNKGLLEKKGEIDTEEKAFVPVKYKRENIVSQKTVIRVRLKFERKGILRFLSHLEQIEFFRNALRRSGLPLVFSEGFSPQPKVSFGPAISVGYESESEYMEISLAKPVDLKEIERRIGNSLTEGYKLIETKKIPLFFPSFDSLVNVAVYKIRFQVSQEQIQKFLSQPEIIIEKKKGSEIRKIDVKPLIIELKTQDGFINLKLRFGPKYNVKAEKIVQSLCSLDENSAKMLSVTRLGFFIEKKDGSLLEP